MVDINNIVSRGGYLVDGVTGEKVLFYECDPRKTRNVIVKCVGVAGQRMRVASGSALRHSIRVSVKTAVRLGMLC